LAEKKESVGYRATKEVKASFLTGRRRIYNKSRVNANLATRQANRELPVRREQRIDGYSGTF